MHYIDREDDNGEAVTIQSVHINKSFIMERKKTLKSLRHLIAMSKEDSKQKISNLSGSELSQLTDGDGDSSTTKPLWSMTNSQPTRPKTSA